MLSGFKTALSSISCGLETRNIFKVLEQASDEMCNYDSRSATDISETEDSVSSVMNSRNEETEELVGDARVRKSRLKDQGDW
jgi:hypothetical protein